MIQHYFRSAWRMLLHNRQSSVINVFGLALGIAVFLLIIQFVAIEWSANRFHKNFKTLYRVNVLHKDSRSEYILPPGYAPLLVSKIPGIENYARVANGIGGGLISYSDGREEKAFRETSVSYVDESFLQIFTFPVLYGSARLEENTLALSEKIAKKIFGNKNAVGEFVTVSNQFGNKQYTVAAIFKNMPENSDIKAEVLLSLSTLSNVSNRDGNNWADPGGFESGFTSIFLLLKPEMSGTKVGGEITKFVNQMNAEAAGDLVYLQPLEEMHLAPSFNYLFQTFGSLRLVLVFASVALLILLIAWVNYVNLSTALALNRNREVGVRKVLGAGRWQLIFQYLIETLLITLVAFAVSLVMVQLLQPFYNSFTGKSLSLKVITGSWFWQAGAGFMLISSLLAGGYVALMLSSNKPITILRKQQPAMGSNGFSVRTALVVFQFSISIMFIMATLVLHRQLKFMQAENLGMNLNELLVINGPANAKEERNTSFKNSLVQLPFVKKYTASNAVPGKGYNFSAAGITSADPETGDEKKEYAIAITDERFFDTYDISFAEGKTFTSAEAEKGWSKCKKIILNEKAASALGFRPGENVAGKKVLWGDAYEVIGVVKDYHHLSLREAIKPTIYLPSSSSLYFTLQTATENLPLKLETLKKLYTEAFPGNPFEYFFADASYDEQYNAEQKLASLFICCAAVAIIIACLGLFGLVSFTAKQRVKEIGIRKVLGANVAHITSLLLTDYLKLITIAIFIALPIAGWVMHLWLQDFAYRAELSWWIFVVAVTVTLLLAAATVSTLALKASAANPTKSLRTE